jgi:hypothetical protein
VDGSAAKHNARFRDRQCAGCLNIPNSCQPPHSLDTAIPNFNITGWTLNGLSQVRDYRDPQWQVVANFGWNKGSHNVKFGIDYVHLDQNHYETQVRTSTFNSGVTTIAGGRRQTTSTGLPRSSWLPSARSSRP